jgi:TPP-dependent pyruvate/acetoin dehydrogenase alpha subunit
MKVLSKNTKKYPESGEFLFEDVIKKMVKIRTAETFIRDSFWDEKIFAFLHLCIGQEASAVGVSTALDSEDLMLGNHRSHGHYLAKGGDLSKMIYEVFGDKRGCCGGFGGSMHMLDKNVGFMGTTPILGSVSSISVGQAFAYQKIKPHNVVVVFLGDGAAEEGSFMESVNLAVNKSCNIIFVIEDNKYSVQSNKLDRKSIHYSHKSLFEGLGAVYFRKDGQSVESVFNATNNALKFARNGRPVVLHLDVLRRHTHSGPILEMEDMKYRDKNDTVHNRELNDCIFLASNDAVLNGNNRSTVNSWIESEKTKTLQEISEVKKNIKVRSFD